ncbi:MAG: gamma-glutamylcyclotransferase [Bacteroidetes bacterium]|nr:gamma-glutamylcyclotransferase [Bacteroidota bacterium]
MERLFVYGTLGPNRPNEHILKNIGGTFEDASVKGILYEKGWGAEMGYPGITLDKNGIIVKGFLFSSDKINKHWSELDKFEGEAYERILTKVETENKTIVEAFIYVLKK